MRLQDHNPFQGLMDTGTSSLDYGPDFRVDPLGSLNPCPLKWRLKLRSGATLIRTSMYTGESKG
jgi:hypothetical protein